MTEVERHDEDQRACVPRPSGMFGIIGLMLGILGIIVPVLGFGALLVSWIGFRSRHVLSASLGYVLGWAGCFLWSFVLFIYLMFSSVMSDGSLMSSGILNPVEGAVFSIRVYQVEHDGSLPDDATGTRILNGAVKPLIASELSWLNDSKKDLGPPADWFKIAYTRTSDDAWKAAMIYSKAFTDAVTPPEERARMKDRGKDLGDTYEFHASGEVISATAGY